VDSLSEAEISRRLARAMLHSGADAQLEFPALPHFVSGAPRPAAVLVPLLCTESGWQILFTRRNADLPEHSGQVSFPGGRADPGDLSAEQTALRETEEEIGIRPADVRILGRLRDYLTITNYRVTPVVGAIPWPYPLTLAHQEVSRAFTIPLDWLADPGNYQARQRQLPEPHGQAQVIYFQPYDGEVLWGASARITLSLIQALK
jgi:8-oxo-dGTP pyrophosphatase MutT (NUDIX family)